MDLVKSVPRMSHEDFESILNSNMQVRVIIKHELLVCNFFLIEFASTIYNTTTATLITMHRRFLYYLQ